MRMKGDDGKPFSERFLKDICVNLILAGRDISSVALAWFFWLIGRHPEVEESILAEICTIIGEIRESGKIKVGDDYQKLGRDVFKPEEIKRMDYLHAAISEALRLYPAVPVDHKEAVEDDVCPDGTELKKGTKIIYAIYSMGRMDEEKTAKNTSQRGGLEMANSWVNLHTNSPLFVATSIIYRYHVKVVKDHPIEPKLALTMYMKNGLKVHVIKRDESELQKYLKG
ncbi:hypothetical protein Cgig2_033081 [Carnegiea gigantea]|uniref:Uncharacterized protein n=1 Tax=Carnegiea gigantea TaxID=171969 RepID=A0A9Q1GU25_9CARY|nr:hypothetical protein Cgig2_033081 [Carnegiea gigantea]